MDHRQFEVGAGIVHRYAAAFGEDDLHQHVGREHQQDGQLQVARRRFGEDPGERRVARQQGQRAGREHERRFDQRAVEGFAARAHAFERTSGVHGAEDQREAAESHQVGEADDVAVERQQGFQLPDGDEERGDDRRAEVDRRHGAEQRRSGRRIDCAFAQQQAHVEEVLGEADAPAARQHGPRAVYQARNADGRQQDQECIECRHRQIRLKMDNRNIRTRNASAKST